MTIIPLAGGITALDLAFQGGPGVIAAYLLEDQGQHALIETGPTSTLPSLLAALEEAGVKGDEIDSVIVTHIHLDHAGAAGEFLRRFPRAKLYVHERGVRHLVDPAKLIASATRIYGQRMDELWGPIVPVPAERVTALTDGDTIAVGNRRLDVLYTPGHASHHVALHDPETGTIFTGDVGAVRLQGFQYVRPATPPPDLDLELWETSLDRLRALHPHTLALTHFGPFPDADRHLDDARRNLRAWETLLRAALAEGKEQPELTAIMQEHANEALRAEGAGEEAFQRYDLAAGAGMSVDGYLRYFRVQER